MGAGKSTLGPILANTLGWDFFDLDREVEKLCKKKVREIFQQEGEEAFRQYESGVLTELSEGANLVISLGGGTIADDDNLRFMKSHGFIIHLKTSPDIAYERLKFKRDRPNLLLEGDDEPTKGMLLDKINEILSERIKYYNQADIEIDTDKNSVGKTVDEIVRMISKGIKI